MSTAKRVSIRQCFAELPEPRREHMRLHKLWDIIALTILGVIAGADSWVDVANYGLSKLDWLQTFLELPNGIPSHDTLGRVFALARSGRLARGIPQLGAGYCRIDVRAGGSD
jgi:DDE_Tnp_1-associated